MFDVDSAISEFSFGDQNMRVLGSSDDPWFVVIDVCACLDLSNTTRALSGLEDDEKGLIRSNTLGGEQDLLVVNEPGLYRLIFKSRKESAKRFQRWVAHEVLPAIRKTGRYEVPDLESALAATELRFKELGNQIESELNRVPFQLHPTLINKALGRFMTVSTALLTKQTTGSLPASSGTLPDPQLMQTINDAFLNLNRSGLAMNKLFHFIDRIPTMKRMDEDAVREMAESLAEAGDTIYKLQQEIKLKDETLVKEKRLIDMLNAEVERLKAETKQSLTRRHVETPGRIKQHQLDDLLVEIASLRKQLENANAANEALRAQNTQLGRPRLIG